MRGGRTIARGADRRSSPWFGLLLVASMAAGTASGCSKEVSQVPPDQPSAGAPAPTTPGATDLVISGTDGAGGTIRWHLTCDPPGGDHPDPEGACRALEDHGAQALPPVAKDRVCTQVYGGPEVATVQGTWHGRPVLTTFSRTDGCQIGRWNALAALLPPVGT